MPCFDKVAASNVSLAAANVSLSEKVQQLENPHCGVEERLQCELS